jgi:phage/conjugal plasmid C-4 type zinc finger TraR family protein
VTDIFDRATELEELQREDALKRQRSRAEHGDISASECGDCGDQIPEERRLAAPGCTRCIDCERINEAKRKTFAF